MPGTVTKGKRWQYPSVAAPTFVPPAPPLSWVSETVVVFPAKVVQYPREDFHPALPQPPIILFSLEECQALWETISELTWPSEELPSGFVHPPLDLPAPSGFVKDPDKANLWDL